MPTTVPVLGIGAVRDIRSSMNALTLFCRLQTLMSINWQGV